MVYLYVGSSHSRLMDCQIDMAVSGGIISSHMKSSYFPSTVEHLHNGHSGHRGEAIVER